MNKIYIVATERGEAASLMRFLDLSADDVTALVIEHRELAEEAACVAAAVKWIDTESQPVEGFACSAANILLETEPAAVVGVSSSGSRAMIGRAAVGLGASVVSNTTKLTVSEGPLLVEHSVLDDKMIEAAEMPPHVCLLVNPFSLQPVEVEPKAASTIIEKMHAEHSGAMEYLTVEPVSASRLQVADRVIGVGLGAASEELFEQTKQLAEVLDAERGCSMPVFNELQLMPHETYIGISGTKIAPKLYLALGISGTSQPALRGRSQCQNHCLRKQRPQGPVL